MSSGGRGIVGPYVILPGFWVGRTPASPPNQIVDVGIIEIGQLYHNRDGELTRSTFIFGIS